MSARLEDVDYDKVLEVLRALRREDVHYVVVGAVAMGIQGIDRYTRDLDLFVEPDEKNIERLKRALRVVWNDPEIETIRSQEVTGEYSTIRYIPPDASLIIDLITGLGVAFRYGDLVSEELDVDGVSVRVATPMTLYKMKRDTIRPQDRVDAANLKRKFNLEE